MASNGNQNQIVSKNRDRYTNDEAFDLDPAQVGSIFQSANSGTVKRQSRLANELNRKRPGYFTGLVCTGCRNLFITLGNCRRRI